jgi:glycosyltransferase involved in cell wall biosynthesis
MIVIVQGYIPHYRRDFFNKLGELYDLVVIHSGDKVVQSEDTFSECVISSIELGPFVWQSDLIRSIKTLKPTVVIAGANFRYLSLIFAMFLFDQKIKWIWWGADKGKSAIANIFKGLIFKRLNSIIFYNKEILQYFSKFNRNKSIMYVANNTFHVPNSESYSNFPVKNCFINVGTLDSRKQNDVLLRAFSKVVSNSDSKIYLYIIGEGTERSYLEKLIIDLRLENSVFMLGKLEDVNILKEYYAKSLASVSFGQAGLAVLQSMAFGVPFVTKRNAISGGEKFNIIDKFNGCLCEDNIESLVDVMNQLVKDLSYARLLGKNAFKYYHDQANIDVMIRGFQSAIEG